MTDKTPIFDELLKAGKIKTPTDASQQSFLLRLWKAIDNLDEDGWAALSKGAQKWTNAAASAKKDDEDLPPIPDAPVEAEAGDEQEEEEVKKPAKKAATAAAKKEPADKPAAKKAAAKKAAPAKKANGSGEKPKKSMLRAARELICGAPQLTVEQLCGKLEKQGYEAAPVTIGTIRSDTRNTLKIAQELGVNLKSLDFDA